MLIASWRVRLLAPSSAPIPGRAFLPARMDFDPWVAVQPFGHLAHAVADVPLTPNIAGLVGGLTLRVERSPTP